MILLNQAGACKVSPGRAHTDSTDPENPAYIIERGGYIMDINELTTLIGSYAFPIVMCIFLMIKFDKTLNSLDDRILSLSVRLDTLIDAVLEKKEEKEK